MKEKVLLIILLLLTTFLLFSSFQPIFKKPSLVPTNTSKSENASLEDYPIAQIPLDGFIQATINVDAILVDRAQVSLKADCYLIEATTDSFVANAIRKALEEKVEFRPTVYDVIADVFRNLGIKVLAVKILEIKENTFIGQLIIQQKDKVLFLDIRPSDATAIALRAKAPIYVNETLAKEVGRYIC